jgi:hypothetical protein
LISALLFDFFLLLQDGSLKYWLSQGVPKNKVLVGIPTYGRKFLLNDSTNGTIGASSNGGGDISYGEVRPVFMSIKF